MDYLKRPLHFAAVLLILWMIGCLVCSATCRSNAHPLMNHLRILKSETNDLFQKYIDFHMRGRTGYSISSEIPDVAISGATAEERLQHIYSKTMLFSAHVQKVKLYHKQYWNNSETLAKCLDVVFRRCGYFTSHIYTLVPTPVPTVPALEVGPHKSKYKIRKYGWGVLRRLQDWITAVETVLTADS